MFKLVKMETAVGTETQLNKLQEDGWRIAGCGPDYIVLSDSLRSVKTLRRGQRDESELVMNVQRHLRENADLDLENRALRKRLAALEDGTATQHWDSLRQSRDRWAGIANELFEALCWASGASDFCPGDEQSKTPPGKAREGWERGPRLAMEAYQEAQRVEREGNRVR